MKIYKKTQIEKIVVDSIVCNMCARVISDDLLHGTTVKAIGGFDNKILEDCTILWFDLCEECLVNEVISKLKIKPTEGMDVSWYRPEQEKTEVECSKIEGD
jgi:hypothetical protein